VASELARRQLPGEENERVASARARAEAEKVARPEHDDVAERPQRPQVPVKRKWTVVETGEGKVVRPEPGGLVKRVRKRNDGGDSPLPDPDKKSPS
jgi:hypothetical protein